MYFLPEGQAYFNKVLEGIPKICSRELDYISQRTDPASGLWITDSIGQCTSGMKILLIIWLNYKKNGWPRELITSTGKSTT